MRATSSGWWRAVKQRSGVCLAIAVLGCGGATEADGNETSATNSSSGSGGSSASTGAGSGGSGGSTTASTSSREGSGGIGSNVASSTVGEAGASGVDVTIDFEDGWAPLDQNEVGVQGAFYTFSDSDLEGNSSIEPQTFAGSGAELCVHGTAGLVLDGVDGVPDYSRYWGAAIGFNLSQEEGIDNALEYDAAAHDVIGFSFVVGGSNPIPALGELRFNVKVAGSTYYYCQKVWAQGLNTFLFTDLLQDCWRMDPTLPSFDPTQLEALHWQYVTTSTASYDFDLCISDLRAIVAPE